MTVTGSAPERRIVETPPAAVASESQAVDETAGLTPIKSPMVGTFYRAPASYNFV